MNKLFKILLIIGIILWCIITIMIPFQNFNIQYILVIIYSIIFTISIIGIYKLFNKIDKRKADIISIIISIVYFIVICYIGLNCKVSLPYDLDVIYDQVKIMLDNNTNIVYDSTYFSVYPHQIPLFCLIYYIGSFAKILSIDPINLIIVFNCFMILLSLIFVYKIVYLITNKSAISLVALLLMALIPDFVLYSCYFYTDIISIPFCIIGMYYILKGNINNEKKYLFIGGLFFSVSIKIRILNLIILIAFFIYNFFNKKIKIYVRNVFIIICAIGIFNLIYNTFLYSNIKFNLNKKVKFPATHWVMMGVNGKKNGHFDIDDYYITYSSNDKTKTNIEEIKNRIKNNDALFYLKKEISIFSISDHNILSKYKTTNNYSNINKIFNSKYVIYIEYLQQISLLSIYILFIISMIKCLKSNNITKEKFLIFFLTIIGGLIFYLFWESNSRYGLMFIPWILIGSVLYLDSIIKYITELKRINYIKMIYLLSCLFIIGFFIFGFFKYSIKKVEKNKIIFNQTYGNDSINIIDNRVKVEFLVNENFDSISCLFIGEINEKIKYNFMLYDSDDKLIVNEEFSSNDFESFGKKVFKFSEQRNNNLKKYYFVIYSDNATTDEHLSLLIYTPDMYGKFENKIGYDINKYEKIYSNDKLLRGEAYLNINSYKKYYLINPVIYILISIINLFFMIKIYILLFKKCR